MAGQTGSGRGSGAECVVRIPRIPAPIRIRGATPRRQTIHKSVSLSRGWVQSAFAPMGLCIPGSFPGSSGPHSVDVADSSESMLRIRQLPLRSRTLRGARS